MAHTCDVCSLPDPHHGAGDGIGSCDCPRGDCGAPDWSVFCTCPTEDDGPACWEAAPGGGVRCGLDVDHEGEHRFTIWTGPLSAESESPAVQASGHQDSTNRPPHARTAPSMPQPEITRHPRNETR